MVELLQRREEQEKKRERKEPHVLLGDGASERRNPTRSSKQPSKTLSSHQPTHTQHAAQLITLIHPGSLLRGRRPPRLVRRHSVQTHVPRRLLLCDGVATANEGLSTSSESIGECASFW